MNCLRRLFREQRGQDIAEYAVLLAVILVIVVGTIRIIAGNTTRMYSQTQSALSN
jgi:Flp pilus assembly pilin Flp